MKAQFDINSALALVAGILILVVPKILIYVIGLYLIFIGVRGLLR